MTIRDTIEDVTKTLLPGGAVVGFVNATDLKAELEIALLLLSVAYTAIRLGMLIKHKGREADPDTGEADPPDNLMP